MIHIYLVFADQSVSKLLKGIVKRLHMMLNNRKKVTFYIWQMGISPLFLFFQDSWLNGCHPVIPGFLLEDEKVQQLETVVTKGDCCRILLLTLLVWNSSLQDLQCLWVFIKSSLICEGIDDKSLYSWMTLVASEQKPATDCLELSDEGWRWGTPGGKRHWHGAWVETNWNEKSDFFVSIFVLSVSPTVDLTCFIVWKR